MNSSRPFPTPFWLRVAVLSAAGAPVLACGFTPSRVPLGGDYSAIEAVSPERHPAPVVAAQAVSEAAEAEAPAAEEHASSVAPASAASSKVAELADVVQYSPLKSGDQIRADVAFAFSAEVQGSSTELRGNGSKIVLEARLHVDVKVLHGSVQGLDELEVTLTPVSLHTDFDGQNSDTKRDPAQTFDVTLSGQSPSVRVQGGSSLQKEDRITLLVLLTPLLEFHNRWARSPSFTLKPGWSTKMTLTPPAFASPPSENVHVGALSVRYDGRDGAATSTPFELGLPIHWSTDFGTVDFDCEGQTLLGARGRPVSLDLKGPITGSVGPPGARLGLRGSAKFTATVTYP